MSLPWVSQVAVAESQFLGIPQNRHFWHFGHFWPFSQKGHFWPFFRKAHFWAFSRKAEKWPFSRIWQNWQFWAFCCFWQKCCFWGFGENGVFWVFPQNGEIWVFRTRRENGVFGEIPKMVIFTLPVEMPVSRKTGLLCTGRMLVFTCFSCFHQLACTEILYSGYPGCGNSGFCYREVGSATGKGTHSLWGQVYLPGSRSRSGPDQIWAGFRSGPEPWDIGVARPGTMVRPDGMVARMKRRL